MSNRIERGFTLIELVVVITILGIPGGLRRARFIALEGKAARSGRSNGHRGGALRSASALSHGSGWHLAAPLRSRWTV